MTGQWLPIRALSLWRPWTELILSGDKTVENRAWLPPRPGIRAGYRMVVHGSKRYDHNCVPNLPISSSELSEDVRGRLADDTAPTGYLGIVDVLGVCTVQLDGGESCECGPWAMPGQAHWQLSSPQRFPEPIFGLGRQGLWAPGPSVVDAVELLLAAR